MRRTAGVMIALVLVAACGGDDGSSASGSPSGADPTTAVDEGQTTTTTDEEAPPVEDDPPVALPADAPEVELVDPGAEPRVELRLSPEEGDEQRITMRQEQRQVVEVGGVEQAFESVTELDVTFVIEEVRSGVIEAVAVYEDARVIEADPAARPMLEDLVARFVGARARTEFDHRGYVLDGEVPDVDLDGVPGGEQLLESFADQLATLALPFPDEPVGPGAVWTIESTTKFGGVLTASTTYRVTLDAVDDEEATASVDVVLDVSSEGAVRVESGALRGTGTTTWRLGNVAPLSEQTITGTLVFTTQGQQVTQHQEQRITTSPR